MSLKHLRCPRCQGELELEIGPDTQSVQCSHCHAVLPVRRNVAPAPVTGDDYRPEPLPTEATDPPVPSPKKKKKKPKAARPLTVFERIQQVPKPMMFGIFGSAVLLTVVVGVVNWLANGRGGNAPKTTETVTVLATNVEELVAADLAALKTGGGQSAIDWSTWKVPSIGPSPYARFPDRMVMKDSQPIPRHSSAKEFLRFSQVMDTANSSDPNSPAFFYYLETLDLATGRVVAKRDMTKCATFSKAYRYKMFDFRDVAPDGSIGLEPRDGQLRFVDPGANEIRLVSHPKIAKKVEPERNSAMGGGPAKSTVNRKEAYWSAGNKYWIHQEKQLLLFDPKTGQLLAETPSPGPGECPSGWDIWTISPNGKVMVVVDPKYQLRLYDADTGKELGTLGVVGFGFDMNSEDAWTGLSVSPDGNRLFACRKTLSTDRRVIMYLHFWSLKTGVYEGEIALAGLGALDHYWYSDHLVFGNVLIDPKTRTPLGQLNFEKPVQAEIQVGMGSGLLFDEFRSPDGRVFLRQETKGGDQWRAVPLPKFDRPIILKPGDQLAVEAKLGDATVDRRAAAVLGEVVRQAGFKPGTGGWTLRATATMRESGPVLKFSGDETVPTPFVAGELALVSPDGNVAYSTPHGFGFGEFKSQFYVGTDRSQLFVEVNSFKFPSDPVPLMRDETWTKYIRSLAIVNWPRTLYAGANVNSLPKLVVRLPPKN